MWRGPEHPLTAELRYYDWFIGQTCKRKGIFYSQDIGSSLDMLTSKGYTSRNTLTGRDVGDSGVLVDGDVMISGWVRVGCCIESHVVSKLLVDCSLFMNRSVVELYRWGMSSYIDIMLYSYYQAPGASIVDLISPCFLIMADFCFRSTQELHDLHHRCNVFCIKVCGKSNFHWCHVLGFDDQYRKQSFLSYVQQTNPIWKVFWHFGTRNGRTSSNRSFWSGGERTAKYMSEFPHTILAV